MKLLGASNIQIQKQLVSTVITGTSPFSLASQTAVTNLNAEMISGKKLSVSNVAPSSPNTNDLWVDTSNSPAVFKFWGGAEWFQSGVTRGNIVAVRRQEFTATAGQTVFTLASGSYVPGSNSMTVIAAGKVLPPSAYTETDKVTVTVLPGTTINAGDKVVLEFGVSVQDIEANYKLEESRYTTTLGAIATKVDIDIANLDITNHVILVYVGGSLKQKTTDYTIVAGTNKPYAIQIVSGNWASGTRIDVVAMKAVNTVVPGADGSTIQDSSIPKVKLATTLQNEITNATNNIATINSTLTGKADKNGTLQTNLNAEMISGKKFALANTAPTTPNANDIWIDTSVTPALMKYWTGSAWTAVGSNLTGVATLVGVETLTNKTLTSPILNGTPTAPTAAADTNTTQVATTAFVIGQASGVAGSALAATAAIGTSYKYARADHVHPTTGLMLTTHTANSITALGGASQALGAASNGSGTAVALANHVHPTTGLMLTTHAANGISALGGSAQALAAAASNGISTAVALADHVHPTTGLMTLSGGTLTGSINLDVTASERFIRASGTGYSWGAYFNTTGTGFYDWQNSRSILGYTPNTNTVTIGPSLSTNKGNLTIGAEDNNYEGGQLTLSGTTTYTDTGIIDKYGDNIRLYVSPSNIFVIPKAGSPTIGGNTIWHSGNLAFGSGAANMAAGNHNHNGSYKIVNGGAITDFNTGNALTDGEYSLGSSSIPNAPYAGVIYGKLIVRTSSGGIYNGSAGYIWQYFESVTGGIPKRWFRCKIDAGAWTAWTEDMRVIANANTDGAFDKSATAPTGATRLNYSGYLYATRVYNAVYNDYAEFFKKDEDTLEPGDVIIKNPNGKGYIKSQCAYDPLVVGVYSDTFGQCLGGDGAEDDEKNYAPIGLAGRVFVKVIGDVKRGDLLTASMIPGVAMAADEYKPGTVIGKALQSHSGDTIDRIEMMIIMM